MRFAHPRRLAVAAASRVAGALGCALLAVGFARLGWWILFGLEIGPVITTVGAGRGIHAGDMLALAYLAVSTTFAAGAFNLARQARWRAALLLARRS